MKMTKKRYLLRQTNKKHKWYRRIKTVTGAAKRFLVSKEGVVWAKHGGGAHSGSRSKKQKRVLKQWLRIKGCDLKKIRKMLPYVRGIGKYARPKRNSDSWLVRTIKQRESHIFVQEGTVNRAKLVHDTPWKLESLQMHVRRAKFGYLGYFDEVKNFDTRMDFEQFLEQPGQWRTLEERVG